jgi:tetratricopeptide (TPR) repeat protein
MIKRSPPAASSIRDDGDRRRLGPAWHRRVGGLHVLKLKGSFGQMGEQHGALLREVIPRGPIPYFRAHVERLLGRSAGRLAPALFGALRHTVGRRVARSLPGFALETVRGIARGAGLPEDAFLDGCTMPDSLMWAVARLIELRAPAPAMAHRLSLGLGCTSAFAWGDATVDGALLHARNFDYHGVRSWPETAAVIFHEPAEGQRYVSISAAGVGLGGITAMNEAGLSLTVHQHMFTDRTRLGGTPIGTVGDVVMRQARSLDDAERILAAQRPIGCWTYLIADGHRRQVLCWEESPDRHAARRTEPGDLTFAYANVYLDDALGATESDAYGSYWRNNGARLARARELLAGRPAPLDPAGMAAILADAGDPRCRVAGAIAMVITTASVVFRPADGVVWVATGEAPTSRNAYLPFQLGREDHAPELGDLPATPRAPGDEAFESYRRAYVAYLDEQDLATARRELAVARALDPRQPVYHATAGLCALEAGDFPEAETCLSGALALGHPDEARVAGFHLWRGRARDLQRRRADAVADYRAVFARRADHAVAAAARRGLRRAWTRPRVSVDFVLGDVFKP